MSENNVKNIQDNYETFVFTLSDFKLDNNNTSFSDAISIIDPHHSFSFQVLLHEEQLKLNDLGSLRRGQSSSLITGKNNDNNSKLPTPSVSDFIRSKLKTIQSLRQDYAL